MSSNLIEKFKINVKKAFEELEETEFKPTKLQVVGINPKPAYYAEVHKKRYFNKLESFCIDDVILTDDLFKLIDFTTCLNAFINSKLDTQEEYFFEDFFIMKIQTQNGKIGLTIKFLKYEEILYFSKIECMQMVARFNKVISRLEV